MRTAVYVITWGDRGPCKYGVAADPYSRLGCLQSTFPYKLEIAAAWYVPSREAALAVEREVLKQTRCYWLRSEWVSLRPKEAIEYLTQTLARFDFPSEPWAPSANDQATESLSIRRHQRLNTASCEADA